MATKRYTPLDDPPSASSDDETEDEQEIMTQKPIHESSTSSEEEEEDESEEETPEPKKIPLEKPKIQNPNSKPSELSHEEELDSDSEGESADPVNFSFGRPKTISLNSNSIFEFDSDVRSPAASAFVVKPSKKINAFENPENTPMSKRPFSGSEIKSRKKIKVSNGDVDEEKKSVIKRVWSVDDELMLLQGFIDYQLKNGCFPLSDMDGFYQFTMKLIPGYASKSQLYEKVRRLKKKFRVTSEKVGGSGEDPVFSKPHERKLFELSNKIWGIDGCESLIAGGGSTAKAKVRVPKLKLKFEVKEKNDADADADVDDDVEKAVKTEVKMEDFETLYPYWNAGLISEVSSSLKFPAGVIKLVKENLSLIGEAKAKELNEKWKSLFENESVLRKRRIALLNNVCDVETA